MVRFKSDLTFDLGSTEVKPRAKEALGKFASILNMPEIAQQEIQVVGHTDDVPDSPNGDDADESQQLDSFHQSWLGGGGCASFQRCG